MRSPYSHKDEHALTLTSVSLTYHHNNESTLNVLHDVTFNVKKAEIVAIIGVSGIGKTSLLDIASGLITPNEGRVSINGFEAIEACKKKLIGRVSQSDTLLPWKTVYENVALPLSIGNARAGREEEIINEMVSAVGLSEFSNYYPFQLSAGMKQRVSVARAFVHSPEILLLDEPFGHLDEITRDSVRETLITLCRQRGTTVIMVTHSTDEALAISDRVVVMTGRPSYIAGQIITSSLETKSLAEVRSNLLHLMAEGFAS
ncbi:ABC transporter ATP-binding protein [Dehalococcoidia bacterium]|nr:ABC transporter ATP-binding protein [Dehalococcoidia bacterium]